MNARKFQLRLGGELCSDDGHACGVNDGNCLYIDGDVVYYTPASVGIEFPLTDSALVNAVAWLSSKLVDDFLDTPYGKIETRTRTTPAEHITWSDDDEFVDRSIPPTGGIDFTNVSPSKAADVLMSLTKVGGNTYDIPEEHRLAFCVLRDYYYEYLSKYTYVIKPMLTESRRTRTRLEDCIVRHCRKMGYGQEYIDFWSKYADIQHSHLYRHF